MPKKKVLLSVLFLSAYLAGIGHCLIPHCHHGQGTMGFGHVAGHSTDPAGGYALAAGIDRCHGNAPNQPCDGILCFLECLLSAVRHPAPNAAYDLYLANGPDAASGGRPGKAPACVLLPADLSGPGVAKDSVSPNPESSTARLSPLLPASPHRGPPVAFC